MSAPNKRTKKVVKAKLETGSDNTGKVEACSHCAEQVVMNKCPNCNEPCMCPECSYCTDCEMEIQNFEASDSLRNPSVMAAHGEITGKPTFHTLEQKVGQAIQEDPRWDTDKHGQPEGSPGDFEPYVVDILVPDDDGHLTAVIRTDDGRMVKHGFTWDGDNVMMDEGDSEPTEPTTVYSKFCELREKDVVKAGGAGNRSKGDVSMTAYKKSADARGASENAEKEGTAEAHTAAAAAHDEANKSHMGAKVAMVESGRHGPKSADLNRAGEHNDQAGRHEEKADEHRATAAKLSKKVDTKEANDQDKVVHCKESGVSLGDGKWAMDEDCTLQWMPGGVTTINAHYGGNRIELTVECNEDTAKVVQASLDTWNERYPKQKPFGCIEHREEEASLYPKTFTWQDEPEPGVFCTGTPSALGVRNVNGRIHRSWSPSFTTDADYTKASVKKGAIVFPAGARGSKSNPAQITGVAFSVGTLTNTPAFKNILPVRAKQATNPQPGSENADTNNTTKGTTMRIKFVKARGTYTAGQVIDMAEGADLTGALSSGDAMTEVAALAIEAKDAENKTLRDSVKANQKQILKDKVEVAKKRGAVPMKDEAVLAKAYERLEKGADIELLCEMVDSMPGRDTALMASRFTARVGDENSNARPQYGQLTLREAGDAYLKEREPIHGLIVKGRIKEAMDISVKASALLKTNFMPAYNRGDDFMLSDVVSAADTSDPNTQVGTLSTGLLLMRNLGYLKNKLSFMQYISTDLRNEPAKFGQPILTRYITPPNVLTFVPGVGYTSDSTTITNASISATTGEAATQTSGTKTPSAPSSTDVTVIINKNKGVEITFPTTTLGSTIRNLFAEQQGAQFYSLAEQVNKDFLTAVFGATWSGNVTTYALGSNFGLTGVVGIKLRFTINKMPDIGRFALLHSTYHDQILTDSSLVTAKAIMALVNKDLSAMESGELPILYGVRVLESQLASATSGTLSSITDPTNLGATNQIGFAGNSASMLFAARVPNDYTQAFSDIPATAAIEILTEPDSGLSILFTKYVDHGLGQVSARCALMYGFKQGDPRQGFILTP